MNLEIEEVKRTVREAADLQCRFAVRALSEMGHSPQYVGKQILMAGYATKLGWGQYRLTELGKAWCGADSVTNR